MICPNCEKELETISASHHYTLTFSSEQDKWVKDDGTAFYSCELCYAELGRIDIVDALVDTGEL